MAVLYRMYGIYCVLFGLLTSAIALAATAPFARAGRPMPAPA